MKIKLIIIDTFDYKYNPKCPEYYCDSTVLTVLYIHLKIVGNGLKQYSIPELTEKLPNDII